MKRFKSELPPEVIDSAISVVLPISLLAGTQRPDEYSDSKLKKIRHAYATEGIQFLVNHPISVVLCPEHKGSSLVILDGHHRTREAPQSGFYSMPSWVVSLAFLANYYELEEKELHRSLSVWTSEAVRGFQRKYTNSSKVYRAPQVLPDVRSIEELDQVAHTSNDYGIMSLAYLQLFSQPSLHYTSEAVHST